MLRMLILIVAVGAGSAAAWITTQQTSTAPQPIAAPQTEPAPEMTAILVSGSDLRRGEMIPSGALRWQDWPANAVPNAFTDRAQSPNALQDLTGHFAARPISQGEPITDAMTTETAGGYLAGMLSPGMRAVGISATPESTAGGFILPNDRVDVLYTAERLDETDEKRSRTILRGVRVLAVDQTTDDTGSGTVLGKTATLELTEEQAEVVTAAEATGSLALSLRPLDDSPTEPSLATVTEKEAPKTIRINRGGVSEDVVVN